MVMKEAFSQAAKLPENQYPAIQIAIKSAEKTLRDAGVKDPEVKVAITGETSGIPESEKLIPLMVTPDEVIIAHSLFRDYGDRIIAQAKKDRRYADAIAHDDP